MSQSFAGEVYRSGQEKENGKQKYVCILPLFSEECSLLLCLRMPRSYFDESIR